MLVKWFELDSSKFISYDNDTLALWAPGWIHRFFLMHCGVKNAVWMSFMGTKYLEMHIMLVYRLIFWVTRVIKPIKLRTVYPIVYILCVLLLLFLCLRFFACFSFFWGFVGISSANPHEILLVHLGEPSGLKGLVA